MSVHFAAFSREWCSTMTILERRVQFTGLANFGTQKVFTAHCSKLRHVYAVIRVYTTRGLGTECDGGFEIGMKRLSWKHSMFISVELIDRRLKTHCDHERRCMVFPRSLRTWRESVSTIIATTSLAVSATAEVVVALCVALRAALELGLYAFWLLNGT